MVYSGNQPHWASALARMQKLVPAAEGGRAGRAVLSLLGLEASTGSSVPGQNRWRALLLRLPTGAGDVAPGVTAGQHVLPELLVDVVEDVAVGVDVVEALRGGRGGAALVSQLMSRAGNGGCMQQPGGQWLRRPGPGTKPTPWAGPSGQAVRSSHGA